MLSFPSAMNHLLCDAACIYYWYDIRRSLEGNPNCLRCEQKIGGRNWFKLSGENSQRLQFHPFMSELDGKLLFIHHQCDIWKCVNTLLICENDQSSKFSLLARGCVCYFVCMEQTEEVEDNLNDLHSAIFGYFCSVFTFFFYVQRC